MQRFRLSRPARTDLAGILAESDRRWGSEAKRRYTETLAAAMRQVAAEPEGRVTRDCSDLVPGVRSFHLRHARLPDRSKVRRPAHVVYYRALGVDLVEIVRVLHERMVPSRRIGEAADGGQ